MKPNRVAAIVSLAMASVALLGCYKTAHHGPGPGASVAIAKQVCEVNALAEERDAIVTSINSPEYGREMETKDHRFTILKEKLNHYSAEVEASYRFVTSNCNSYNLCMAKNNYDEHACSDTRKAWVESHGKFNELAVAINEINNDWRRYRGGKGHHRKHDCTQGGVFASGSCYDGD